jgi:formamidopyrimidine-DNA glycosylase
MSGSLRIVPAQAAPDKHDHIDIRFDARAPAPARPAPLRAGAVASPANARAPTACQTRHRAPERRLRRRLAASRDTRPAQAPIKQLLMDSHVLVGIGNIYASESLFVPASDPVTLRPVSSGRAAAHAW